MNFASGENASLQPFGSRNRLPDSTPQAPLWHRGASTLEERALELEQFEREARCQKKSLYLYLRYGFEYLV